MSNISSSVVKYVLMHIKLSEEAEKLVHTIFTHLTFVVIASGNAE